MLTQLFSWRSGPGGERGRLTKRVPCSHRTVLTSWPTCLAVAVKAAQQHTLVAQSSQLRGPRSDLLQTREFGRTTRRVAVGESAFASHHQTTSLRRERMSDRTLFVAGKECDASQQRSTFNVSNRASTPLPSSSSFLTDRALCTAASGETVWSFPSATEADCDAAVACAAAALGDWEAVTPGGKRAIFLKAAELVATPKYKDRIAECMSKETSAVPGWM